MSRRGLLTSQIRHRGSRPFGRGDRGASGGNLRPTARRGGAGVPGQLRRGTGSGGGMCGRRRRPPGGRRLGRNAICERAAVGRRHVGRDPLGYQRRHRPLHAYPRRSRPCRAGRPDSTVLAGAARRPAGLSCPQPPSGHSRYRCAPPAKCAHRLGHHGRSRGGTRAAVGARRATGLSRCHIRLADRPSRAKRLWTQHRTVRPGRDRRTAWCRLLHRDTTPRAPSHRPAGVGAEPGSGETTPSGGAGGPPFTGGTHVRADVSADLPPVELGRVLGRRRSRSPTASARPVPWPPCTGIWLGTGPRWYRRTLSPPWPPRRPAASMPCSAQRFAERSASNSGHHGPMTVDRTMRSATPAPAGSWRLPTRSPTSASPTSKMPDGQANPAETQGLVGSSRLCTERSPSTDYRPNANPMSPRSLTVPALPAPAERKRAGCEIGSNPAQDDHRRR